MEYEVNVIAKLWAFKRYTVNADHPDEAEELAFALAEEDVENGTIDGWDMCCVAGEDDSHVERAELVRLSSDGVQWPQ